MVPGKPEESQVVARNYCGDPDVLMPPPESNKALSEKQKAMLAQWISEGAAYAPHWAYQPPRRPAVPNVKDAAWLATMSIGSSLQDSKQRDLLPRRKQIAPHLFAGHDRPDRPTSQPSGKPKRFLPTHRRMLMKK